jgi:integrase
VNWRKLAAAIAKNHRLGGGSFAFPIYVIGSAMAGLFVISEHLGHCNTEITSNIYVHIFKEYKAKMAESIEHDLL